MAERATPAERRRLTVIVALVCSLVLTLFGLYWVQLLDPHKPRQTAGLLHDGQIVIPAARGLIVDATGQPLLANESVSVVTVDRNELQKLPDHGHSVLVQLGKLLGRSATSLAHEITPCSPTVRAPCWTGEPFQPVPVATDVGEIAVLTLSEHREWFPGVAVTNQPVREYLHGSLAAHLLGYRGDVTDADKKANPALSDVDIIGKSGLEQEYDSLLRGVDGSQTVSLDPRGIPVGHGSYKAPQQGDTLVTSIDENLQALSEQALVDQIQQTRQNGKPATSGALVVMDPNTGRVLAAASYPTYDPQLFVGGISSTNYAKLTAPGANDPLVSRAIAGAYAPGSTFKLITSSSLVMHNEVTLTSTHGCPGAVSIDGRVKTNFESEAFPYPLTLRQALQVSCDTWFYMPEADEYYADENRIANGQNAHEYLQRMAAAYGVGTSPGLDLPADEQATGSYADRETRLARWKANKAEYCKEAASGYPDVSDPADRDYLTKLAAENCTDGWRYRAGDNADMAIGQGETTLSPLQLAVAYSALVNGGTIWKPTIGWAVVNGHGKVVKKITPTVKNKVPVSRDVLDYIADSLHFESGHEVSGALAFDGSPYKTELGGKTGTAEVFGHQDTSWFASWGPVGRTDDGHVSAKFVIVGMIEQGGTGATAAAPMVHKVYDGIFGIGQSPVLPDSTPPTTLPTIAPSVSIAGGGR